MRFSHLKSLCLSGAVFIILFTVGFLLSEHKLLWIDECYSQHQSVDEPSYADILILHFPDGNKSPLFYILQKINSNIFNFRYPMTPSIGSYDVADLRSQIIIRIPSNIYMSFALACIFYYFTRFFSLFAGIYALVVALISPMVWLYWVEARPYSLWFLLTTLQALLYCSTVHYAKARVSRQIAWVHALLILTTPGSIFQIVIVTLVLLLRKKYSYRQLFWIGLVPACIFFFYYAFVPVYRYKTFSILGCLCEAIPPERIIIYSLYGLTAWMLGKKRKESSSNTFFFPIFLLFLLSACFVLFIDYFTVRYQFGFYNRYLIYLVPVDILMFTFASIDCWQWSRKDVWVFMNVVIFFTGVAIIRGLITYREILATALYLHSPG